MPVLIKSVTHDIEPVYNINSRVLILGTIPSPKSREYGFYYSHPQNRFWIIISNILNIETPNSIEGKKELLTKHNIALWDVIKTSEIAGADDNSIKNVTSNDINSIVDKSGIKTIFTTGVKATKLYEKYCYKQTNIHTIYLPSTSAANCRHYTIDSLCAHYRLILNYL